MRALLMRPSDLHRLEDLNPYDLIEPGGGKTWTVVTRDQLRQFPELRARDPVRRRSALCLPEKGVPNVSFITDTLAIAAVHSGR